MILKLALTVLIAAAIAIAGAAQEDCVYDPSVNYFPDQILSPQHSKGWELEYFGSYKIATNLVEDEKYLLYQCGSTPPDGDFTATIEIPVQSVGIDMTPAIPFLEQLGVVDKISVLSTSPTYVSSPCLKAAINATDVLVLQSPSELDQFAAGGEARDQEILATLARTIGFISPWNTAPVFEQSVKISESSEHSNAATFEWIKFFSAFFNAEKRALDVFDMAQDQWACVAKTASESASADKTVLWAYYADWAEGWDVASCPDKYYCDYAQTCAATLLSSQDGTIMTTEEFVEFGKDADHFVFVAGDWDEKFERFGDQLSQMKSVRNKEVYDYQGSGTNAWFEQRFPEYFAVLQDFCSIVGTTQGLTGSKTWFRNVYTSPVGDVGECTEESRSNNILPIPSGICDLSAANVATNDRSGAALSYLRLAVIIAVALAVAL